MNPQKLNQFAKQGYNLVPIHREVLADCETPLSVYLKFANCANSYLLESVQGGEKWGRYSIIGLECKSLVKVYGNQITVLDDKTAKQTFTCQDPFKFIKEFKSQFKVANLDDLPRMSGGLVGYFGYDYESYGFSRLSWITR